MDLVGNALEGMPQGGSVTISAENRVGCVVIEAAIPEPASLRKSGTGCSSPL
jgi:hypothetical protein